MNEEPFELRAELLDDFFAECDEQLSTVRTKLAGLEKALGAARPDGAALEAVYRNVHSFKGNAAIVGLSAAEELAHATEGLLRRLTRNELPLEADTFDLLARSAQRLEQIVEAFRAHRPLPDASDIVAQLAPYAASANAGKVARGGANDGAAATGGAAGSAAERTPPTEVHASPAAVPSAHGSDEARHGHGDASLPTDQAAVHRELWHATFAPSRELDERGVNVNSVRARLATLGEILSAAPHVAAGGQVRFEFTVAVRDVPADAEAWAADGITLRPESTTSVAPMLAEAGTANRAASAPLAGAPSHIVRVDLSRLDELLRIVGEMVIQRSRLQDHVARLGAGDSDLQEVNLALGRSLRDLRAAIMRVRLVPVVEIFSRLPFVVRDLSRDSGKKVRLVLEGQDTEIDKYLVERLKEPLLHLVRNAISHGIEMPEERTAAGKPAEATLLLRASAVGDSVHIDVRDDGRGIDARQVAERARAAGLDVPEQLGNAEVLRLICTPGFSTRDEADRAAGRGVGMAVVETTIRDLAGGLVLNTQPAAYTQFTLRVPLTLSIVETLIVSAGAHTCAVPRGCLEEIVQVPTADLRNINHAEVGPYRGALLPLVRLRAFFGDQPSNQPEVPVLVVSTDEGLTGLVVDRVHGQREVVVRPIRDPLLRVPGVSGATELGDGKPILILDAPALTNGAGAFRPLPKTTGSAAAQIAS